MAAEYISPFCDIREYTNNIQDRETDPEERVLYTSMVRLKGRRAGAMLVAASFTIIDASPRRRGTPVLLDMVDMDLVPLCTRKFFLKDDGMWVPGDSSPVYVHPRLPVRIETGYFMPFNDLDVDLERSLHEEIDAESKLLLL